MKQASVISVNPGRKTLGELCMSDQRVANVSRSIAAVTRNTSTKKDFVNFFFGINNKISNLISRRTMAVRIMCSVILSVSLAFNLNSVPASLSEIPLTTFFGVLLIVSLAFGLFTRVTGAIAFTLYGYIAINSLINCIYDSNLMLLIAISGIAMIYGPGKFSLDSAIRYFTFKALSKSARNKKRNNKKLEMGYRAFELADRHAS